MYTIGKFEARGTWGDTCYMVRTCLQRSEQADMLLRLQEKKGYQGRQDGDLMGFFGDQAL